MAENDSKNILFACNFELVFRQTFLVKLWKLSPLRASRFITQISQSISIIDNDVIP